MKSWGFVSLSLFFFFVKGNAQRCNHYVDTADAQVVDYMPVDTSLLRGHYFVLLLEVENGASTSCKFENVGDSILITRRTQAGCVMKKVRGSLQELNLNQAKLYYASGDRIRHKFNMMVIGSQRGIFQIIPHGSTVEAVLGCIESYDVPLFRQIRNVLELKNNFNRK